MSLEFFRSRETVYEKIPDVDFPTSVVANYRILIGDIFDRVGVQVSHLCGGLLESVSHDKPL
jgi:hypothetical protein